MLCSGALSNVCVERIKKTEREFVNIVREWIFLYTLFFFLHNTLLADLNRKFEP